MLTVTNNGTGTATTAQVQDQLPTGLTFVSAGGTGWVCANASGLVTCDFSGSIAPSGRLDEHDQRGRVGERGDGRSDACELCVH